MPDGVFVVQKHASTRLHYDLRLEIGGVLVSWAVPRGPSLDPAAKRLAVRTDDHDLGYLDFEGVIGPGYGAGTVIVWDTGVFVNQSDDATSPTPLSEALDRGHLTVWLAGHKLTGGFALTRTGAAGTRSWLLVKKVDGQADRQSDVVRQRPESVLSGRTNDDLVGGGEERADRAARAP